MITFFLKLTIGVLTFVVVKNDETVIRIKLD